MKKADKAILLAIVILLLLSGGGVFITKTFFSRPGAQAIISQDGKLIHSIDLSQVDEPYEFTITTKNNGFNTVYLEKDHIKFSQANCPDQLCVKTGLLSHTSDLAVCLPHKLMIEIKNGPKGHVDVIAH